MRARPGKAVRDGKEGTFRDLHDHDFRKVGHDGTADGKAVIEGGEFEALEDSDPEETLAGGEQDRCRDRNGDEDLRCPAARHGQRSYRKRRLKKLSEGVSPVR